MACQMALVCGLTTFRLALLLLSAPSVVGVTNSADITGCVANRAVLAVITGCVGKPCKGLPCEVSADFFSLSCLIRPKKVQQALG